MGCLAGRRLQVPEAGQLDQERLQLELLGGVVGEVLVEPLDQPDRIDALFIQQVAQKKTDYLYAIGAEEPPTGGFQARPHAAGDFLRSVHRRYGFLRTWTPAARS